MSTYQEAGKIGRDEFGDRDDRSQLQVLTEGGPSCLTSNTFVCFVINSRSIALQRQIEDEKKKNTNACVYCRKIDHSLQE